MIEESKEKVEKIAQMRSKTMNTAIKYYHDVVEEEEYQTEPGANQSNARGAT